MIEVKSKYQQKIDELHKKIQDASKQLQSVLEQIDSAKKDKMTLLESYNALLSDIKNARLEHQRIVDKTQEWREMKNLEVLGYDRTVDQLKEKIAELEIKQAEIKAKNSEIGKLTEQIEDTRKAIFVIMTNLDGLKVLKNSADLELQKVRQEVREEEKKLEEERKEAGTIIDSAIKTAKDVHAFYNSIGPWISAIAQWHAVHGGEMPELLHDWKPKQILVSSKIHKLLKNKQK